MFGNLNQEQYSAIRYTQPPIWSTEGRGISVEPLHRGFVFTDAVDLFVVEDGAVRRVAYDRVAVRLRPHQRYRTTSPISAIRASGCIAQLGNGRPFDFAIVQGATFFRAIARGQNSARSRAR